MLKAPTSPHKSVDAVFKRRPIPRPDFVGSGG
jgi:hypothetical protein